MQVCNTNVSEHKPAIVALSKVYGVGKAMAKRIMARLRVPSHIPLINLSASDKLKLRYIMEQRLKLGDALKQQINNNITVLKNIGCYRGLRHRRNLPVRGQRTRSNAHTRKYYVADDV
ncbi:30S ribosomal protein S13 [Candidatus Hodgkinia cicadicola]|nr:30S ribosomal protein S13 [Candidatus Hodgkinia cicadicola]